VEQIRTHLAVFDRLEQKGYAFPRRRVKVLATTERAGLGDRVAGAIHGIPVDRGLLEHAYYDGLRFMISARSASAEDIPLVDGGVFDWLGKLTSNQRLVLVASGMGSQLAAYLFRT
jgi:hypothetical protein